MLIRRCAVLSIEPAGRVELDLAVLFSGGSGLSAAPEWVAVVAHRRDAVPLSMAEIELLGRVDDLFWMERGRVPEAAAAAVERLLAEGLLVCDAPEHAAWRAADDQIRHQGWYGPGALLHARSRWSGVDSRRDDPRRTGLLTLEMLAEQFGPIPPHFHDRPGGGDPVLLPGAGALSIDEQLAARTTCRNFDASAAVPIAVLSSILRTVFGAVGTRQLAKDSYAVKKRVPSGGGLHPIGAYLIVQRVHGVAPGLYHYHCGDHLLQPLAHPEPEALANLALRAVAGQEWFANAPVLVVLAARFLRSFWKYRNHPKAYRVLHLDAGHLSQTLFLAAGELGYGAFITAAINEVDLEQALGLDGMQEGPLAVLGFGARAERLETVEFDPQERVWNADGSRRHNAEAANAGAQSAPDASMLAPHVDPI